MENHTATVVDIETGLTGVYQTTVEPVKPQKTSLLKIMSIVIFLTLCAGASFFFTWHLLRRELQRESEVHLNLESSTTTADHQKALAQIAKSTKSAIHLHAKSDNNVLQWETGKDQSFAQGELRLEDNDIIIPHNGLYFVYSQASFNVLCKSDDEDNTPLSYRIRWKMSTSSSKNKRYLLNGVKSACRSRPEEGVSDGSITVYDSIYLGAVFQLYKGDRLSTDTNSPKVIEKQSSKTFFGVFEL